MTELKTLRDIEKLYGFHDLKTDNPELGPSKVFHITEGGTEKAIYPSYLRQEAIKWIKSDIEYLRKIKNLNISNGIGENIPLKNILNEDIGFIRKWMERFNITEEDLI